jgi:5'(3')-deoxyribonucleotidase
MKIGMDVDDVVAELLPAWLERFNKEHGTGWTTDDLTQWKIEDDLQCTREALWKHLTPDIYEEVKPVPGALAVINALKARGHEVIYISSCHDMPTWLAKSAWLVKHGFLMSRDQAFPVGAAFEYVDKASVGRMHQIQILVDDNVTTCNEWGGVALVMNRPHNMRSLTPCKRLKKFDDLLAEVKYLAQSLAPKVTVPESPVPGEKWHGQIGSVIEIPGANFVQVVPGTFVPYENDLQSCLRTMEIRPKGLWPVFDEASKPKPEPEFDDPALWIQKEDSKPTNPKDALGVMKVPLHFVSGIVKAYASIAHYLGNVKYGAWNYRNGGARASVYLSALQRHIDRWVEGQEYDSVDGTPHLANALACINILIESKANGNLIDDRPPSRINELEACYSEVERIMKTIVARYPDRKPKHFTIEDTI